MASSGGGNWSTQNKVLPGTYINFTSKKEATSNVSERGTAIAPIELPWLEDDVLVRVTSEEFITNAYNIFAQTYDDSSLVNVRELFKGADVVYFYRTNSGGTKASATIGGLTITAKTSGERGNDITVAVTQDMEDTSKYLIETYLDGKVRHEQTISSWDDLDNSGDFVTFEGTGTLDTDIETVGIGLSGGVDGVSDGETYSRFLELSNTVFFNTMACPVTDDVTKDMFKEFVEIQRNDKGKKFQVVAYDKADADFEGVISVANTISDVGYNEASLVYWTTGMEAGTQMWESLSQAVYNGEYQITALESDDVMKESLLDGNLVFGANDGEFRIVRDINTFTSFESSKNSDYSNNQVIRVIDNFSIDVSDIFNKSYVGKEQNDPIGRDNLNADVSNLMGKYQGLRVLQNISTGQDLSFVEGDTDNAVYAMIPLDVVVAMEMLYLNVEVS